MTTESTYPVVDYLIDTFGNWLKHRRELSEIRQMDRTDFDRIAGDLRISTGDLDRLVHQGPHAPRMNCRSCSRRSASTRSGLRRPSLCCCAIWSAFAPSAIRNANATATLPPVLRPSTLRNIASTHPRSKVSASRQSNRSGGKLAP